MNRPEDIVSVWETIIHFVRSCKGFVAANCRRAVDGFKPLWPEESWKTFVLWISLLILDPLICYVPVINDKKKLIDFDKTLLLVLLVLYAVIYLSKLSIYGYKFHSRLGPAAYSPSLWWAFVVLAPLVPVFTNGWLLLILAIKPTTIIRASLFTLGTVLFLILYLVKVFGIYKLFITAANISETRMKTALLRILVNLLLYLYGGHLFGGLWYLFAIWKKMDCWNKSCVKHSDHSGCYHRGRGFIITSGDNGFLDDVCYNMTDDEKIYELGIFKDALESRIVETRNLAKKLLYSFRWAAQNLSGLGQCLEVSTHAWENIFVIVMTIYAMATFTFFIGNMQNLIKSSIVKREDTRWTGEDTRWTREDLEKWSPFGNLTEEQQNDISKKCQECNWPQTGVVNVKNLLNNLPRDVQNDIKRALISLDKLRHVNEFKNWSDKILIELIDCAKPVCYEKHAVIIQHDSPINEMLILVQGKLQICFNDEILEDETFCGKELVECFQNNPHSRRLPRSTKIIQVIERVDAFALMSYDLQNIFKRQAPLCGHICI